jgi:hypothetical protein
VPGIAGIISMDIISITDNTFDYYAPYTQFIGFLTGAALVVSGARRGGQETALSEPAPATASDPEEIHA